MTPAEIEAEAFRRDDLLAVALAILAVFDAPDFSWNFGIPTPQPGRPDAYSGGIPVPLQRQLVPLLVALRASVAKEDATRRPARAAQAVAVATAVMEAIERYRTDPEVSSSDSFDALRHHPAVRAYRAGEEEGS